MANEPNLVTMQVGVENHSCKISDQRRVHYVILTSRPLKDSSVVGWPEKIVDQPTCGGVRHDRGSRDLL